VLWAFGADWAEMLQTQELPLLIGSDRLVFSPIIRWGVMTSIWPKREMPDRLEFK
jgi:hypothetical protein